jgi:hypothetical protein
VRVPATRSTKCGARASLVESTVTVASTALRGRRALDHRPPAREAGAVGAPAPYTDAAAPAPRGRALSGRRGARRPASAVSERAPGQGVATRRRRACAVP